MLSEFAGGSSTRWLLDLTLGTAPTVTATVTAPAPTPPRYVLLLKKPKVKGKAVVGKRLRATPGTWSPKPSKVRYRWTVGGKKVGTKKKLKVKASMVGSRAKVRVRVTTAAGSSSEVARSKRVRAAR